LRTSREGRIDTATPSQPIRISGWSELPPAGTPFCVAKNKKDAEKLAAETGKAPIRAQVEATENGVVVLPLIVKTDVTGSVLAIKHELAKITHERVVVRIIQEGIGAVSENDMKTAQAAGGTVIAFNVGTDSAARDFAERTGIEIGTFSIIYELKEHVESTCCGTRLLA